ncbi:hypothetical protein J3Q64DRAFT_1633120 [Phycomyces blakesleeanus]|uniref:Uncharacterized protein n=1 Tax=Phycomyces blakesleeanus TaxID=4837 RepID=A0ABR3BBE5_PHYBL
MRFVVLIILFLWSFTSLVCANMFAYSLCQSACCYGAVVCYKASGAVFGTIKSSNAPQSILICNGVLGACSSKCAVNFL